MYPNIFICFVWKHFDAIFCAYPYITKLSRLPDVLIQRPPGTRMHLKQPKLPLCSSLPTILFFLPNLLLLWILKVNTESLHTCCSHNLNLKAAFLLLFPLPFFRPVVLPGFTTCSTKSCTAHWFHTQLLPQDLTPGFLQIYNLPVFMLSSFIHANCKAFFLHLSFLDLSGASFTLSLLTRCVYSCFCLHTPVHQFVSLLSNTDLIFSKETKWHCDILVCVYCSSTAPLSKTKNSASVMD